MKKTILLLLLLTILAGSMLPCSVKAEQAPPYVDDQAMLLKPEQVEKLNTLAEEASQRVGCGIYVLTVWDYKNMGYDPYQHISDILYSYYFDHGYGLGEEENGILLMLSMKERDFSMVTYGFGDDGLTDAAKDYLLTKFLDDFKKNSWYNGFSDYITYSEKLLQKTLDGHPFTENTATPRELILGIVLSVGFAFFLAWRITRHFEKQMISVETKLCAWDFASPLRLQRNEDRYTHTSTTRVYDPPQSSSRSGGGGGGGFGSGSSRSGKF